MKGVELLASLLALLIMIGITGLLGGVIIFVINLAKSGTPPTYSLYLSPIYPPIKYETMLLSYLETNISDYQIKKILAYAAYQKNVTNIFIDGKIEITGLTANTTNILNQWFTNEGYLLVLNVDGVGYIIAENRRAFSILPNSMLNLKRISIPLYIDSSSIIKTDKTYELPLNITLDFYVQ